METMETKDVYCKSQVIIYILHDKNKHLTNNKTQAKACYDRLRDLAHTVLQSTLFS